MSKHDFSREEFATRLTRTRAAIAAAGLDWLVAIHPVSIHWLTGSDAKSYQEFQCLLISAQPGPLVILTREGERNEFRDDALVDEIYTHGGREPDDPIAALDELRKKFGLKGKRIGIEVPAYYLHPYDYLRLKDLFGEDLVAEPTHLINELKMAKSEQEQVYIRKAASLGDDAMDVLAASLQCGRTELELSGEVYRSLLAAGSWLAGSPMNLVSGERSCFSHGAPTMREVQQGDIVNVEYGATWKRYTSTIGRQFHMGEPTARVKELYAIQKEACDICIAEIRAGVPAVVPHEAAKKFIADAGYDHGRVHLSGYAIAPGFPPGWAEPLHMFGGNPYTLQAGMVVSVEPPIFLGDEHIGVRLIDNVMVTETGCELLSRFSRDIVVING